MIQMKKLHILSFLVAIIVMSMSSCIDDSFTTSSSDQPEFSVDTLKMGVVFTDEMTTTHRFTVRNMASKSLSISRISLSGEGAQYFRLNVDGFNGRDFNNVEIRGKDSIYVFVEATLPENHGDLPIEINANIDFLTNGVGSKVVLSAMGQDVTRLHAFTTDSDIEFSGSKPYQIFDSLVVAEGTTLNIAAGTRLLFHDKASLIVKGRLICEGSPESPVILSGDRTGNVVSDISFDLMSRQWEGIEFRAGSKGNIMSHTIVKNTTYGIVIDGEGGGEDETDLTLHNSRLRNSGATVLAAFHANVSATGCEFAESGGGLVYLQGGKHVINHCTLANYYLFSVIGGPALSLNHIGYDDDDESGLPYLQADITNSILYGLGTDMTPGDLTESMVFVRNCLLKSNGTDDDNFIDCLWDVDPLYYTVRNDYIFDYRLREESPAIGTANPELTLPQAAEDSYGLSRGTAPDLGAYVFSAPED